MTTSQTRTAAEYSDSLKTVIRRGRLLTAQRNGLFELDAAGERFELLGPFDNAAYSGDDVEIVGVMAPKTQGARYRPALLVRHIHRL